MKHLIYIVAQVFCITACTGSRYKAPSTGRPFEVFVVSTTDDPVAISLICNALSMDVEALPQSEPQFDAVKMSLAEYESGIDKRNVVIVDIDPVKNASPTVTWITDDDMIQVFVHADSRKSLSESIDSIGGIVRGKMLSHEMTIATEQLKEKHNPKAEQKVWETTGIETLIPADVQKNRQGTDFIWLSNDAPAGMQNICIYSYPGITLNLDRALKMRDSVMGGNIRGETKDMRMTTVAKSVTTSIVSRKGHGMMVLRGLWEMTGDAMGGPFVSISKIDSANSRIVVKEAFVYAPESKKRNLIKPLEAAIFTEKNDEKTWVNMLSGL